MPAKKQKVGVPYLREHKTELLESIARNEGRIKAVAADFGNTDRQNIYRLAKEDADIARALERARSGSEAMLTTHDLKDMPEAVIASALEASHGIPSLAASRLGVRPPTLRSYLSDNPKMKKIYDDARENVKDKLEHTLIKEAMDPKGATAIKIWVTKNLLQDRGYEERPASQGGLPPKIEINIHAPGIHGDGKEEVVEAEVVQEIDAPDS